jgi:Mg/Co/Ni transporter MgtE
MTKKKTGRKKGASSAPSRVSSRKTTKHVDLLLRMDREERSAHLEALSREDLARVFEESHAADLVNILLDLKKAVVKRLFETVAADRKRGVLEAAVLYHYKEYLTNPLPLRLETDTGAAVPNYYAILGIPREASDEDLKSAFRYLEKAHAPEVFSLPMRKSGEERLKEIEEAYQNLKSPERRARADRLLPNISYLYPRRDQSWLESVNRIFA